MAITDGLYEFRALKLLTMCLDISGGSKVRGANLQIYAENGLNPQKFYVAEETTGKWSITNAASGLVLDVKDGLAVSDTNVQQWTDTDAQRAQRWKIIDTGDTVTVNGVVCSVYEIGSYVTTDGETLMMDVDHGMTSNNTNVRIHTRNGALAQRFAAYPTMLMDRSMPVPAGLGWTSDTNVNPYKTHAGHNATSMRLGWRCPDTWVPNASRTFERRTRRRLMSASNSTWGGWSAWSTWQDVSPLMRGGYCYDTNAVDASFSIASHKAVELQAEVRCKTSTAHGQSASNALRNIVDPSATLTSAGASAEGLLVDVTSDYAPAWYGIKSIDMGGAELLAREVTAELLEAGQSLRITIPWARLLSLGIPDEGATATAHYTKSTDLFTNYSGGRTFPATLDLGLGEGPDVAPTVTPDEGLTLKVEHPLGILGAWTSDGDGVYPTEDGSHVVYPFGKAFDLLVAVGDGTVWHQTMPVQDVKPCHAWNWDGGALLLEVATGRMVTSRTVKATADVLELDGRPWQAVTFAETLQGTLKASGALHDGSASTVADVMALVRAHHATYRAPSGEVMHVAVTDAQYESAATLTDVDVSMVQEAR